MKNEWGGLANGSLSPMLFADFDQQADASSTSTATFWLNLNIAIEDLVLVAENAKITKRSLRLKQSCSSFQLRI